MCALAAETMITSNMDTMRKSGEVCCHDHVRCWWKERIMKPKIFTEP